MLILPFDFFLHCVNWTLYYKGCNLRSHYVIYIYSLRLSNKYFADWISPPKFSFVLKFPEQLDYVHGFKWDLYVLHFHLKYFYYWGKIVKWQSTCHDFNSTSFPLSHRLPIVLQNYKSETACNITVTAITMTSTTLYLGSYIVLQYAQINRYLYGLLLQK